MMYLTCAAAQVAQMVEFPPVFVILVATVLLVVLIATASQGRRFNSSAQNRICQGCGAAHPHYANFCRRCGRRL
ncbi:hypothetical protein [Fontivita pretiosa]|jgi:ribosomal protein L40E|uniref:hypothetical protein n=1 Tax=Fontivita pretiosa TaxID=2989684 RepID=UPI003D1687CF